MHRYAGRRGLIIIACVLNKVSLTTHVAAGPMARVAGSLPRGALECCQGTAGVAGDRSETTANTAYDAADRLVHNTKRTACEVAN